LLAPGKELCGAQVQAGGGMEGEELPGGVVSGAMMGASMLRAIHLKD